ncbi:unnamed protein product [Tilletia laevis]|nr:unnamed protein product [Tilletia controversa]CAD6965038.1 unnamed protein product [Tilletia laevis]CAD6966376.1 unnamed protein product [Tilletia laevis]CAD7065317.1 unnamed protein product [Tilletia caries]
MADAEQTGLHRIENLTPEELRRLDRLLKEAQNAHVSMQQANEEIERILQLFRPRNKRFEARAGWFSQAAPKESSVLRDILGFQQADGVTFATLA